tara:strand:- start:20 stop:1063 length:1044 start_codon:yes stop_codon:yes gene_type:complete
MIISKIDFIPYRIPFKSPFKTALNTYTFREGVIIKIQSGNIFGFGETASLPGFSKETLTETRHCLEGFSLALEGKNEKLNLEDLLLLANAQSFDNPSALFGLETAIYDLFSQKDQIPIWKFFQDYAPEQILFNGLENDIYKKIKFPVYKIKLIDKNIFNVKEKINHIQNKIGTNSKIRIDANGSLDLPRAIRLSKELEKFNIEYIEQPLPQEDLEDLAELRLHTEIPIALDESLTNLESAKKIIDHQAADIFVLKPMLIGSFETSLDIIKFGNENNIDTVITTTLGTEIERHSCIHLAFAGNLKLSCGLATSNLLLENVIKTPIIKSRISKPIKSGLGINPSQIPYL